MGKLLARSPERAYSDFAHDGGSGLERWYIANCYSSFATNTGAPSANVLRAIPFVAPAGSRTLDRLGYRITATAAGNTRIGLYANLADETNLYPGALIVDGGSQVNANAVFTATISVPLVAGKLYWLAIVGDAAPTISTLQMASCTHILGVGPTFPTTLNVGISVAHAFAALPATFTAGGAEITAAPVPALYFRYSS